MSSVFDEVDLPDPALTGPDLEEERRLGAEARALLESQAYQRVRHELREMYKEHMATAPVRDTQGLQLLRTRVQVLDDIHLTLSDTADSGRMAVTQLDLLADQRAELHGDADA